MVVLEKNKFRAESLNLAVCKQAPQTLKTINNVITKGQHSACSSLEIKVMHSFQLTGHHYKPALLRFSHAIPAPPVCLQPVVLVPDMPASKIRRIEDILRLAFPAGLAIREREHIYNF